jgi:hypothetical protein
MSLFIETLEDRSLMSATLHAAVTATVVADEAAVIAARQNIREATVGYNGALREAQINVRVVRSEDLATLAIERRKFVGDRGNANERLEDQGELLVDQAKLRADTVSANQEIKEVAGNRRITLANDRIALRVATLTLRRDRLLH